MYNNKCIRICCITIISCYTTCYRICFTQYEPFSMIIYNGDTEYNSDDDDDDNDDDDNDDESVYNNNGYNTIIR